MVLLSLLVALAGSLTCWYGVWRAEGGDARAVTWERAARLVVPIALAGWVLSAQAAGQPGGPWLLVGLGFALAGDIAQWFSSARDSLIRLGLLALAHLGFLSAFLVLVRSAGFTWWMALIGLAFGGLLVSVAGTRVRVAATAAHSSSLGYAAQGFIALSGLTAIAAGGAGRWAGLLGAILLVVSDTVLLLDRYVAPRARAALVSVVTYHVALAGLVLGIVG